MKTPIVITAILLLSSLFVKAQDSKTSRAQPDSMIKVIPFGDGRHSGYLYTIGGKLQTPEDVKLKLLAYAPSAQEYHKAKTNLTWGIVSVSGFALSSLAATIEYATHNKHAGETTGLVNGEPGFIYQHHSLTGAYIFTGMASAFLISSIVNFVQGAKHANKAVHAYN